MTHIWYLDNLERVAQERDAIDELQVSADWLVGTTWHLHSGALAIDAIIQAHNHDYHVRMTYPAFYPSSPPTVRPLNADQRLSAHQYGGADGPLCLEWGPDTWQPSLSGAHMLESTYRLFDIENPLGEERPDVPVTAPSRHYLTQGQETRFASKARFYVSPQLQQFLSSLTVESSGTLKFSWHIRPSSWLGLIHQVHPRELREAWQDTSIPHSMKGYRGDEALSTGVFYKTTLTAQDLNRHDNLQSLATLLDGAGHDGHALLQTGEGSVLNLSQGSSSVVVIDNEQRPHFFFVFGDGTTWRWTSVFSENKEEAVRQPDNLQGVAAKSIGIVGLGSVGSKMAESFARMGAGKFYLVDHDLFLPENATRHALDWCNVADHKVDAIQDLISHLNPTADVAVSRLHLVGQESNAAVNVVLQELAACDIIVDATADAKAFNLLAGVAAAAEKPFLWMEVYGGGRGGMIGRSRPGRDPDPYTMRAAYNWYCDQNPPPEGALVADYTTSEDDGQVLAASDADVGILAHHAARFAVDTLLAEHSVYPYSLYLIGLAQWWVFHAPFHTIPIATDELIAQSNAQKSQDADAQARGLQIVRDLLVKLADGTQTTN